jgi:pyruvate dehydrogenase E1 component
MNLMLLLGAAGLSHSLFGERLIPVGTVYDPFVVRGLDALNYACYQDARFLLVGTPSGVTLAPEGGAHQSIGTPLIGMAQDGLAAFEPAYLDELSIIMDWAFDYLQRAGEGDPDERTWLRDETGGSVYLRLSTRPVEQPSPAIRPRLRTGRHRRRLLAARASPNCDGRDRLPGLHRARGNRRHGRAGRAARRSAPRRHLRPTVSMPAGRRRGARGRAGTPQRAASPSVSLSRCRGTARW